MVIFHCYVSSPEGIHSVYDIPWPILWAHIPTFIDVTPVCVALNPHMWFVWPHKEHIIMIIDDDVDVDGDGALTIVMIMIMIMIIIITTIITITIIIIIIIVDMTIKS